MYICYFTNLAIFEHLKAPVSTKQLYFTVEQLDDFNSVIL